MSHDDLHISEDLLALRMQIGRLSIICDVDVSHYENMDRLLAGDFSNCRSDRRTASLLRALLILRCHLEARITAGIGVDGLIRLWRRHNGVLVRRGLPKRHQTGQKVSAAVHVSRQ